jgi:hypothetical protein
MIWSLGLRLFIQSFMKKKYNYLVAENFLCVPTLLKIVIDSYGYSMIQISDIANYFGITLPEEYKLEDSNIVNVRYSNEIVNFGIHIGMQDINALFKHFILSLKETYVSVFNYNEYSFLDYISELSQNNDVHVIFGLDFGVLVKDPNRENYGHVCLLIDVRDENVIIYNPGPYLSGEMTVNYLDLFDSIRRKRDGIWIIASNN